MGSNSNSNSVSRLMASSSSKSGSKPQAHSRSRKGPVQVVARPYGTPHPTPYTLIRMDALTLKPLHRDLAQIAS